MIEDLTREYAIPLIFRFWIHVTTALVNNGCSAHLLKALPRVCSGQQVDSSCVVQSRLLATSANEQSIGKELVELIAIISKLPATNPPQIRDSSPTAEGVVDGVYTDEADHRDVDDETESDFDSDVDGAFAISPTFISTCASLSPHRSKSPVPPHTPQECILDPQSCTIVSPTALEVVGPQRSWNRQENNNSGHLGPNDGSTRDASLFPKASRTNSQEHLVTCPEESISEAGESEIPPDILPTIQRIAGPEIISTLRYFVRDQRTSLAGINVHAKHEITKVGDTAEDRIERLLSKYQLEFDALSSNCSCFPELPWRLYLANIHALHKQEIDRRRQLPRQRKRRKVTNDIKTAKRSLNDIFIDLLLPYGQSRKSTGQSAKRRFENWMALGRTCAKLVESFGAGLLLLIPRDLSNEILRALTVRQEDAIITYIKTTHPGLKSDIRNLTNFLSHIIEGQRPPSMKLKFELSSGNEMMFDQHTLPAIQDLFDYSDGVDYTSFLTDEALSSSTTEPPHFFAC